MRVCTVDVSTFFIVLNLAGLKAFNVTKRKLFSREIRSCCGHRSVVHITIHPMVPYMVL